MKRKAYQVKQHRLEIVFSGYDFLDDFKFTHSLDRVIKDHVRLLEDINKEHLGYQPRNKYIQRISFRWKHHINTCKPRERS